MERCVSNHLIKSLNQSGHSELHDHGPTAAEIQRWEDDGGAIAPDRPSRNRIDRACESADGDRAPVEASNPRQGCGHIYILDRRCGCEVRWTGADQLYEHASRAV